MQLCFFFFNGVIKVDVSQDLFSTESQTANDGDILIILTAIRLHLK